MAKRFIDTELWDKEWFMNLSCKLKCLVKLVRDKADLSGVWAPNWTIAKTYIGETVTETELLSIDEGKQFKKIPGGKIFCLGFIEFQYGQLSEKSPVHRKIINLLETHKIPYKYPIQWVEEKEEEEDKEEEEEKEEVKEEDREQKFRNEEHRCEVLVWPSFDDWWSVYDKKVDRKACEKKWEKLSHPDKERIMIHTPNYVDSTPKKEYRKNPETYLNNRSWENEIIDNGKQASNKSESSTYNPATRAAELFNKFNATTDSKQH